MEAGWLYIVTPLFHYYNLLYRSFSVVKNGLQTTLQMPLFDALYYFSHR
jgi:hypothetical protein